MQRKENSKREPLAGRKSSPIKSVVRTAGSEVKPPISPSSELVVCSGSEEEDEWRKEIWNEAHAGCLYCAGLLSEDYGGEECVRCPKFVKWAHNIRASNPKRNFVCGKYKK